MNFQCTQQGHFACIYLAFLAFSFLPSALNTDEHFISGQHVIYPMINSSEAYRYVLSVLRGAMRILSDFFAVSCFISYWMITELRAQQLSFCDTPNKDPCVVANETTPHEPEARYANCQHTNNGFCDRYITPGWYRYNERMLDRCPSLLNCGTLYPSWLNGSHPVAVNEEVVRIVCKVGFEGCCTSQATIKIRNCGQFMAYCLPALDTCPERYCFGTSGPCKATSSEVSTTLSTHPVEQDTTANPTSLPTTSLTNSYTTITKSKDRTTLKDTNTESAEEKTSEETRTQMSTQSPTKGEKDDSSSSSLSPVTISIIIATTALCISFFLVIFVLLYHRRRVSGPGNTTENTYERPIVAVPAVNEYDMPVTLQKEGGVYDELPSEEEYQNEAPRDNPYDVISDRAIQNNTYGK